MEKNLIYTKRADNVKIVTGPGGKPIYICPYPESHFEDEVAKQRAWNLQKIKKPTRDMSKKEENIYEKV